eukprot:gene21110-25347_t
MSSSQVDGLVYACERRHVKDLSPEEFERQYIARGIPVILEGLLDQWPCYRKWTTEYFRENHGDEMADVDMGGHGGVKNWMKLRDYIDSYEQYLEAAAGGAPVPYLRVWNFLDTLPQLEEDVSIEPYFKDYFKKTPGGLAPPFLWLFFGPKGVRSNLHVDIWFTDAWLCNLEGSKHFWLYHPSHRKYLQSDVDNKWVNHEAPDREKFPDFDKAIPVEAILKAGEMIYIPRKWPHAAVALDNTVSLTSNFLAECNRKNVMQLLVKYMSRRQKCEKILGRALRGGDNLMKFCCHGGRIPIEAAKAIMGAAFKLLLNKEGEVDLDKSSDEEEEEEMDEAEE